jgi:hypothetical protein
VDRQILDLRLFDQLVGPVLLQINQAVDVASEPINPSVDRLVDELGHRLVRQRKRTLVAIEAADKPVSVQLQMRKR